jgi:hypothetical protein
MIEERIAMSQKERDWLPVSTDSQDGWLKHGKCPVRTKPPEYTAYQRQRSWCRGPKGRFYEYYGGRGIEFRFETFPEFYKQVGDKPSPDHWLMRLDSDGHFEAGNLHWVRRRKKIKRGKKWNRVTKVS